jgi:transposase
MDITITFARPTVKQLTHLLQTAFRAGHLQQIKRLTALLLLADQHSVACVAERLGVCKQTIYNWLHAFVLKRWASLVPRTSPGRRAKLTAA